MMVWRWSKVRWALTIWIGLILIWIVVDVTRVLSKSCTEEDLIDEAFEGTFQGMADCAEIYVNGKSSTAIEHGLERLAIGLVGAAVIGLVWLLTRDRGRTCPQCGENVTKGLTACPKCGYDFAHSRTTAPAAAAAAAAAAVPAGWYEDSTRPGHKRWWDGDAWGMKDDEHPAGQSQRADQATDGAPTGSAVEPEPVVVAGSRVPEPQAAPGAASPAPEPVPEPAQARFCENCGAPRRPGGNFCTSCGHA